MIQVRLWLHPRHMSKLTGGALTEYVLHVAAAPLRAEANDAGLKLVGRPEVVDILSPQSPDALAVQHLWDEPGPQSWGQGVSLAYVQQPARRRWFSRSRRTVRGAAGWRR